MNGLLVPTQLISERNGIVWSSTQTLELQINPSIDPAEFKHDTNIASKSDEAPRWSKARQTEPAVELAPDVILLPGAWNTTIVRQDDGVVLLEAPMSEEYFDQVLAQARRRYPSLPVKAVLSTSDSWPHVGGVRFAVSQHFPLYILDLNQALLNRMLSAPYSIKPDALAKLSPAVKPQFHLVSTSTLIGTGDNRMELIPLRGASTERQYAVYFPARRLLYASDTLALNDDGSLYDPELMNEVRQVVLQEHLQVDKVFSMHQGPLAWDELLKLLK